MPKHPESQIPSSYYDPAPKVSEPRPSTKPPSLEDFFPAAKKANEQKRRPVPAPAPRPKPAIHQPEFKKQPVSEPVREPKKQLQKVFENMTSPEKPKPSIKDLETKKNLEFACKETIPYQMKNTHQKMDALDQMNALIDGVTDLSYLNQDRNQRNNFDTSDQETDVYG